LVIIGVLLIVLGAGMAVAGQNQIQAGNDWDREHCTYNPVLQQMTCPENPYEGGGGQVLAGLILVLGGGVVLFYGTR
jgi:hypothetical protein